MNDTRENYSREIEIQGQRYDIEKIGEGAGCVCYEVTSKGPYQGHKLKEFYPLTILGVRKEIPLRLFEEKKNDLDEVEINAYEKRLKAFKSQSLTINEVKDKWDYLGGNMLEKPELIPTSLGPCYDCGSNIGTVLDKYIRERINNVSFKQRLIEGLRITYFACLDLKRYHPSYVNLDIKASNLLYIPINHSGDLSAIRTIDFSSCVKIDDLEKESQGKSAKRLIKEMIFSTQQFYDKVDVERAIEDCIKNSFNKKSRLNLLNLDLRALVKLLFYILDASLREIVINEKNIIGSLETLFIENDLELWGDNYLLSQFDVYSKLFSIVKDTFSSDIRIDLDHMITRISAILSILKGMPFVDENEMERIRSLADSSLELFEDIENEQKKAMGNSITFSEDEWIIEEIEKYKPRDSIAENKSQIGLLIDYCKDKSIPFSVIELNHFLRVNSFNDDITPNMEYDDKLYKGKDIYCCIGQIIKKVRTENQLILGEASMGKSTIARVIEDVIIHNGKSARVIDCNDYDKGKFSFYREKYPSDTVWIFDGFEEMTDRKKERDLIDLVQREENIILASRYNPEINGASALNYLFGKGQICTLKNIDDERMSQLFGVYSTNQNLVRSRGLMNNYLREQWLNKMFGVRRVEDIHPFFKTTMFVALYLKLKKAEKGDLTIKNEASFIQKYFKYLENEKKIGKTGDVNSNIIIFGSRAYDSICKEKIEDFNPCYSLRGMFKIKNSRVVSPQQKYLNYALASFILNELFKDRDPSKLLDFKGQEIPSVYREALYYVGQLLKLEEKGLYIIKKLDKLKKDASNPFLCALLIYCGYNDGCLDDIQFSVGKKFPRVAKKLGFFNNNKFVNILSVKCFCGIESLKFYDGQPHSMVVNKKTIQNRFLSGVVTAGITDAPMILYVGNMVEKIRPYAFAGRFSFTTIIVLRGNKRYYSHLANSIIDKKTKKLILGNENSIIPNDGSVLTIGRNAFNKLKCHYTIPIPDTVKTIEEGWVRYSVDKREIVGKNSPKPRNTEKMKKDLVKEYIGNNAFLDFINRNEKDNVTRWGGLLYPPLIILMAILVLMMQYTLNMSIPWMIVGFVVGLALVVLAKHLLVRFINALLSRVYLKMMLNCQKWVLEKKQKHTYFEYYHGKTK